MIGFSVLIRRDDGSTFFALPENGFSARVWFLHSQALSYARDLREHRLDAVVVKVIYNEPTIIGPKRYMETLA